MRTYNLSGSMSDRINFDDMVERHALDAMSMLDNEDILKLDVLEYATLQWEDVEATSDDDEPLADDMEEAQARWMAAYVRIVQDQQAALQMADEELARIDEDMSLGD